MLKKRIYQGLTAAGLALAFAACKTPELVVKNESRNVPAGFTTAAAGATLDSASTGKLPWKQFFADPNLQLLIESALQNNQELNITLQEIEIAKNEVRIRKGEYLPFVSLGGSAGAEKVGRYTIQGATEENINIREGRRTPDPLTDFQVGAFATWEVDIWHKLRNARKAAALRYLASVEGRNFMVTNVIAEIANSYYELLALDNQLAIVRQSIGIQSNALELVKLQKESARTTELAVKRFEAQVQHSRALQFKLEQSIVETENKLNFLAGRYPQPVARNDESFNTLLPTVIQAGLPTQLLGNRPDIRQAEQQLAAAKLDVQVARASFYPALRLTSGVGFAAYNPALLLAAPESMLFSLAGDAAAPLFNRNGIKALYYNANATQTQAVYRYEKSLLNAYVEVTNQLANISNLEKSYDAKAKEVAALNQSVSISNDLFRAARAEYTEVLFTQREALEARFDLIETRLQQLNASVNVYRALGGGWK